MKIALQMMSVNPKFWVAASQEAAGFEPVWVPEPLTFPVEMSDSPTPGTPNRCIGGRNAITAAGDVDREAWREC